MHPSGVAVTGNVDLRLALQAQRANSLAAQLERLLGPLTGEERALDSGCGAGALAFALAPHVREVIGVDASPELVEAGRRQSPPNVTLTVGDATALPFGYGEFDLAGCLRVLHHVRRPELVISELARVTVPGGTILVVDQLGDVDPLRSIAVDRFERARDPSHTRLLPDGDIRSLLEANDVVVVVNEVTHEERDLERYLDVAGVPSDARNEVRALAPGPTFTVDVGWYVARRPRR
jgi:SAM-dependent methyltransferase